MHFSKNKSSIYLNKTNITLEHTVYFIIVCFYVYLYVNPDELILYLGKSNNLGDHPPLFEV